MRKAYLIATILALASSPLVHADDAADRERKARAALALAATAKPPVAVTAPVPHVPAKTYAAGYKAAADSEKPLVVFVGCPGRPAAPGAVVSHVEQFGDVKAPAVVVGYPAGDRVFIHVTLECPVAPEKLATAIRAAARKINDPPARAMPAPVPLDWNVMAEPEAPAPRRATCPDCDKCPTCANKVAKATDPRDALVRVRKGEASGSGTVVWSAGGQSVVLTAAHVLSPPGAVTVRGDGRTRPATVLAVDPKADLAALLVAAELPAVKVCEADPEDGAAVTMLGLTSIVSRATIAGREGDVYVFEEDPEHQYSDSGDSGAGVFYRGELCGVHCGRHGPTRDATHTPYCAGAKPVRSFLGRVLKRDGGRTVLVAPSAGAVVVQPSPGPAAAPVAPRTIVGYRQVCQGGRCVLVPVYP